LQRDISGFQNSEFLVIVQINVLTRRNQSSRKTAISYYIDCSLCNV